MAIEDIIWGKNRHVFGGIEPSSMVEFEIHPSSTGMEIKATPPSDTVVDGQTLCTVGGVVIRRRSDRFPENEFDGDEVITKYGTEPFVYDDKAADPSGAYFYAAYPFSTQGVYNRSDNNRASVNTPADMVLFNVIPKYDAADDSLYIDITYQLPDNVAGAMIRWSDKDYPTTVDDGELIINATESGTYGRFGGRWLPDNTTIYFSAFTYSSNGVYNHNNNEANRAKTTPKKYNYYYGYDIILADENPSTRVTYETFDGTVDNANYTPAGLKSNNFSYGGWADAGFMPKPCMLKYDGTVDYYLNPNDYTKQANGSNSILASTSASIMAYAGNAMMEWPQIWTKRWVSVDAEGNKRYCFRCSDVQIDDDYECWCNYDRNGNRIDHFYTSIFIGQTINNSNVTRLRSLSGVTSNVTVADGCYSMTKYISAAKGNGDDWTVETFADRMLINDLLVLMSRSTNGEASFGIGHNGYTSDGNYTDMYWHNTKCGSTNKDGLFKGNSSGGGNSIKIFGMEDWWGRGCRYLAGWIETNNSIYVKITRSTKDGSTATDYNETGTGYIKLTDGSNDVVTVTCSSSAYIKDCLVKPYGRFPVEGTTTLSGSGYYECDGFSRSHSYNTASNHYPLCVSQRSTGGQSVDGPFKMSITYSNEYTGSIPASYGTGLSCKPCKGV